LISPAEATDAAYSCPTLFECKESAIRAAPAFA